MEALNIENATANRLHEPEPTSTNAISTLTAEHESTHTGNPDLLNTHFHVCVGDVCGNVNNLILFVGWTFHLVWDPDLFSSPNSTVQIIIESAEYPTVGVHVWTSDRIPNSVGNVSLSVEEAWLHDFDTYNLTFRMLGFNSNDPMAAVDVYHGPVFIIKHPLPNADALFYQQAFMFGLPIALLVDFLLVTVLTLCFRKQIIRFLDRRYGERKTKQPQTGDVNKTQTAMSR